MKLSVIPKADLIRIAGVLIAYGFGVIGIGYFTRQSDFWRLLLFYLPMFAVYFWIVFFDKNKVDKFPSIPILLGLGILFRFILLFSFPSLSDDVFRFVWDGRLWNAGVNPFEQLPSFFMEPENHLPGLTSELFDSLNSPEYFTIYPPVCQGIFYISTLLFPEDIWSSMFLMKLFLFCFEAGTLFLLPRVLKMLDIDSGRTLIYALNPLIIIELSGNLHFEGAMIFFLLLALFLILKKKLNLSSVAFGLSVASKLLPLIFLPFLVSNLGWKKSIRYGVLVAASLVVLYSPILSETFIGNFGDSLNLYFQKFEFNASVYYISRWIGYQKVGWNMIAEIGPGLATISFLIILVLAFLPLFLKKSIWKNLPSAWLWGITVYLLFTTTVHPWYVSLPVFLCCFSQFRFPVIWSGLIFLTYINYHSGGYSENLWIVAVEYLIVFLFMISELRKHFIGKNIFST